jgi:hypothetical protein
MAHYDVEPTNNHGELELRDFVLWRKRSFGRTAHARRQSLPMYAIIAHRRESLSPTSDSAGFWLVAAIV